MDRTRGHKRLTWRTALNCNGGACVQVAAGKQNSILIGNSRGRAALWSSTRATNGMSSSQASRTAISTICSNDTRSLAQVTR